MAKLRQSLRIPYTEQVLREDGFFSNAWLWFFRAVEDILKKLGQEEVFTLVNNQAAAADVTNLVLNKTGTTMAVFEYLIQRVTTGGSAVELTEVGILMFVYEPTSESWAMVTVSEHNPDDAGVVFSITAAGQVQYTTTNIGGTASISTLWYRLRTLSGKNTVYSTVNR